ncbi:WXG100 family type VII secretion target [Actinoplanes flavus]|uniref:Uncharacterized protein n=1 Tax=Actinoplanes flavus TaxID=2820290 RepID=A0ABS3UDL8_9ACTN|nr:hypothetical protein [Actinoplanes flavus]MBO3736881.1 hypothetical protein [Actinoplanes flavus]
MGLYGDPDELDRLAARLREKAARIRDEAATHEARGHAAAWVSDGAAAYRERLSRDRAEVARQAAGIDHAAALLTEHAESVRQIIADIARIERETRQWFVDTGKSLVDRADDLIEAAGRTLRRGLTEPPWVDWPFRPDNLPAAGDVRWLEVGRFLRGEGAL